MLEPEAIAGAGREFLLPLIRPAGFVNAKAGYLVSLADFFLQHGGSDELACHATDSLRAMLLGVRGVGPETADAILLYLFDRPVWIADQYAARLFERLHGSAYDERLQNRLLRAWTEAERTADLQELHALIVAHGKRHCRSNPVCDGCPLRASCLHGCGGVGAATAGSR